MKLNKKYEQATPWIAIMIVSIIGLVALQIMVGLITSQTTKTTITDDSFTAENSTCVQITDKCIFSLTLLENGTDGTEVTASNYTTCQVDASGEYADGIQLESDSDYTGSTLNATYEEVECGYITGLTALVVNNVPILAAIALLVFAAGFAIAKR